MILQCEICDRRYLVDEEVFDKETGDALVRCAGCGYVWTAKVQKPVGFGKGFYITVLLAIFTGIGLFFWNFSREIRVVEELKVQKHGEYLGLRVTKEDKILDGEILLVLLNGDNSNLGDFSFFDFVLAKLGFSSKISLLRLTIPKVDYNSLEFWLSVPYSKHKKVLVCQY